MSRNIDRWVRAMRDDVTGLANEQQQPSDAEIRAARQFVREWVFKSVVARLEKRRQPRTDKVKLAAAEALLRRVDRPAPSDTRERFLSLLAAVAEKQQAAMVLREDLEARRKAIVEQRAKTPKLELVKDGTEPAQSAEQKPREPSHGPPMVAPGWVSVSPRRSTWWHLHRRAPGH